MSARLAGPLGPACALFVCALLAAPPARGEEPERPSPLPEPILTETVTDIDGDEAGELELELNAGSLGALRGGQRRAYATAEGELKLTSRLGARLELGASFERGGAASKSFVGDAALAVSLVRDYARELHVQLELAGRVPRAGDTAEPGESALPAALDLRAAHRHGPITLRASVGAEAFGSVAHAPIRAGAAVLAGVTRDARHGFFGVELDVDAARPGVVAIAPEIVADGTSIGLPFVLGVAVPIVPAAGGDPARTGFMARLIWVSEREAQAP